MWCNDLTSATYGDHLDEIRRDLLGRWTAHDAREGGS